MFSQNVLPVRESPCISTTATARYNTTPSPTNGLERHQCNIYRWRVRVSLRTQTQMGMRIQFPDMPSCAIRKQLAEQFPKKVPDIVIACWDIELGHREHIHCGTHTQHIRCCLEYQQLSSHMIQLHRAVHRLWASGRTTVRVMCICEKGVQKSVAAAAIMHDFYRQQGYNSKGPHHMSRCGAGLCWNCVQCNTNVEKDRLMAFGQATFISQEFVCSA